MATLSQPTLQELIVEIRDYLGQPDPNNSNWTDQELARYVNEAIRRYYSEVVQNAEGHFNVVDDLDIVAGEETVALPTDCFEVARLYKKVGNDFIILPSRNTFSKSYTTQNSNNATSYGGYYYLRGNDIVLRPPPNFSETAGLRIEYTQVPDTVVNGGDAVTNQISPIFRDLLIQFAAWKAKVVESSRGNGVDTSGPFRAMLSDTYANFQELVRERTYYPEYVQAFNPEDF